MSATTRQQNPAHALSAQVLSQAHLLRGLSISRLPANLLQRLVDDSSNQASDYRRVTSLAAVSQREPNSSYCGTQCAPFYCGISALIKDGTLGVMREDNTFNYLAPGYHAYCCCGRTMGEAVNAPRVGTSTKNGPRGLCNVGEGCIGVLTVGSTYKLLAPGIYEWNSPNIDCDAIVSLSSDVVVLGPYRLISVPDGMVAVTYNNGALCILGGGDEDASRRTYFLDDVKWTFSGMLPTVIQTDRLEGNDLLSKDNVEILMVAMSHWRVVDPGLAITNCAPNIEGIRTKTNQLVRATIARIVAGTNIGNGPVSGSVAHPVVQATAVDPAQPEKSGQEQETDLAHLMQSAQATQHMAQLSAQMALMGVEVLGVFVPEKRIKNDDIRSQIARQAVIGIRAEAQRAAADATAYATLKGARAQAEAIELLATAHAEAGRRLGEPDSTASRLALSENLGRALTDANVTLFSGAPGMLPFMFGNTPAAPAGGGSRKKKATKRGEATGIEAILDDDEDVDLVAAARETDS